MAAIGDQNTTFFHARTAQRRAQNIIHGLENDQGIWKEDKGDVENNILSYFSSIFTSSNPQNFEEVLRCMDRKVTNRMNQILVRYVTTQEVKQAVFQMDSSKAPGLDGFTVSFFQSYWYIVGRDIVEAVRSFTYSGRLLRGLNHTHIVLIPKVKYPMKMGQLRPISLCNVAYRVLPKVLANRLSACLPTIVSKNQGAFVAGWLIHDNVILGQEGLSAMLSYAENRKARPSMELEFVEGLRRLIDRWKGTDDGDYMLTLVAMIMWRIWKCRNEVLFNGADPDPSQMVVVAVKEKSMCGKLKFNVDGAWVSRSNGLAKAGAGIVVRDSNGSFVAARSLNLGVVGSPLCAEAMAWRAMLDFAILLGLDSLVMEGDSQQLVRRIRGSSRFKTSTVVPLMLLVSMDIESLISLTEVLRSLGFV
ncbi:hypothetical protein RHSIM_Rhsim02G0067500 [Rhododendron simsii]|uniref:RNase H type-1 domain-containing protein n=1 Tax=Rhododendron simsii TaxID=118357 RepID=A0A834LVD4_RHOSS|nr:hypothetical protein RHSIM_Rhsim02G0067500 [Rhododendron simsii]